MERNAPGPILHAPRPGLLRARAGPREVWFWIGGICALLVLEIALNGTNGYAAGSLATIVHLALGLAVVVRVRARPEEWRLLGPRLAWAGAPLAWLVLAYALGPNQVRASGAFGPEFTIRLGFLALLVAGALLGLRGDSGAKALSSLAVIGALWALAGSVMTWLSGSADRSGEGAGTPHRFAVTLDNPNVAGAALAMIALACLDHYLTRTRTAPVRRVVQGAALFAILVLIVCTGSRAAMIAFALAAVVRLRFAPNSLADRDQVLGYAAVVLAALAVSAAVMSPAFLARFADLTSDLHVRIDAWLLYAGLSVEHPVFGFGLGSFRAVNTAHLTPANAEVMWRFGAAHNFVLQAALEAGWLYVLLLLAWAATFGRAISRRWQRRAPDDPVRTIALVLAIALVCGWVDIALDVPAIASLCAWLAGIALGNALRVAVPRRGSLADEARP
ncbi:hypothetical protein B2G71_05180 [Novosphingobium sp. PC22D]|nr:hypothetical protein B2G71_05180 [Novosphingobium sp. PC22D]